MPSAVTRYLVPTLTLLALSIGTATAATMTVPLIAGQNIDAGSVDITYYEDTGEVAFSVLPVEGLCLLEVHAYVGVTSPKKSAPGRFPYHFDPYASDGGPCAGGFSWVVTLEAPAPSLAEFEGWSVAFHSVVGVPTYETDWSAFNSAIDDVSAANGGTVTYKVAFPGDGSGDPSYFDTTIADDTGVLSGIYDGWCVDTGRVIRSGVWYEAEVVTPYVIDELTGDLVANPRLGDLVDSPENFDLVQWIVNQGFVGMTSPGEGGTYTRGDVQRAIWSLIDDTNSTAGLGAWDPIRVDEIVAAALANGEGFVPGCGDVVALVLNPLAETGESVGQITIAQVTLAEVGLSCEPFFLEGDTETAWAIPGGVEGLADPDAFGFDPFGRGWGGSFEFVCDEL